MVILTSQKDDKKEPSSGIYNSIHVIGSNTISDGYDVFNGYIEHLSDICYLNLPDLKLESSGSTYNKLKLPEFNLLLFNNLMNVHYNKIILFEQLL